MVSILHWFRAALWSINSLSHVVHILKQVSPGVPGHSVREAQELMTSAAYYSRSGLLSGDTCAKLSATKTVGVTGELKGV